MRSSHQQVWIISYLKAVGMKKYKNHTLQEYLKVLSQKTPTPGGGSTAALSGALGSALLCMVARYSLSRGKPKTVEQKISGVLRQCTTIQNALLDLVDLDAQAYLAVVKARKLNAKAKQAALKKARQVPLKVCRLCFQAVAVAPYLVEHGNKYLLSDVEVALDMLQAAYSGAMANVRANQ